MFPEALSTRRERMFADRQVFHCKDDSFHQISVCFMKFQPELFGRNLTDLF